MLYNVVLAVHVTFQYHVPAPSIVTLNNVKVLLAVLFIVALMSEELSRRLQLYVALLPNTV